MSDIKLCYFGGSGGFILLHLLLLSDQFHCVFQDEHNDLHEIINSQWCIVDKNKWKQLEIWPNNISTQISKTCKSKIYFFCNPTVDNVSKFDGNTVLLYTDIESQLELAFYKKAYMFSNFSNDSYISYYRNCLKRFKLAYDNFKDPSWPVCYGPKKFSRLPLQIQQEVMNNLPREDWHVTRYSRFVESHRHSDAYMYYSKNSKTLPNGNRVIHPVFDFFNYANVTIKLQDVINNLDLLSDITHVPTNTAQIDLRNKWVALHPLILLNSIGINAQ